MTVFRGRVDRADERGVFVTIPDLGNVTYGPLEVLVDDPNALPAYSKGDRVLVENVGRVMADDFVVLGHRKRHDGSVGPGGSLPTPEPDGALLQAVDGAWQASDILPGIERQIEDVETAVTTTLMPRITALEAQENGVALTTQNLNTILTTGLYYQDMQANATLALNYPNTLPGILEVFMVGTNLYQRYTTSGATQRQYLRGRVGVQWYTWTEFSKTTHTHAASAITSGTIALERLPLNTVFGGAGADLNTLKTVGTKFYWGGQNFAGLLNFPIKVDNSSWSAHLTVDGYGWMTDPTIQRLVVTGPGAIYGVSPARIFIFTRVSSNSGSWSEWVLENEVPVYSDADQAATLAALNPTVDTPIRFRRMDKPMRPAYRTTDGVMRTRMFREPPQWTAPVLEGGFSTYNSSFHQEGFMKTSIGIVVLTGLVKGGANGAVVMTLPVGYRPTNKIMVAVSTNNAVGRVDIHPDGRVIANSINTAYLSLDGIMFPSAEAVASWGGWVPITNWNTGWSDYYAQDTSWGVASYVRDPLGRVWFSGLIRQNTPSQLGVDSIAFWVPFPSSRQRHIASNATNAFGSLDTLPVAPDAFGQAWTAFRVKTPTVTNWVNPVPAMFLDSSVNDAWTLDPLYVNGFAKYPNATLPENQYIVLDDGMVMLDGLISGGAVGAGEANWSQFLQREAMADVREGGRSGQVSAGPTIFLINANNAAARVDLKLTYAYAPRIQETNGSTTWRTRAGINYMIGEG